MQTRLFIASAVTSALLLGACAQQEEPETMVMPEPVYDKYGNVVDGGGGGCVGGSTAGAGDTCLPPPGDHGGPDDSSTGGGGSTPGTAAPG